MGEEADPEQRRGEPDVSDRTVDPAEVERYRALAELWWREDGRLWPLHTLNRVRKDWIREQIGQALGRVGPASAALRGLEVLDIGCGGGLLSEAIAEQGALVTGIDVVADSIEVARRHAAARHLPIDYRLITAEQLLASGRRYDLVLNMEVVEHVADLDAFMRAANRLVKPGGHMVLATINRTALSWLVAIIGAEVVLRLLPKGTHQWRRFPTPREVTGLLARDGLRVTATTGVRVDPFRRRMWLCRSMAINYMLLAQREGAHA
jgi:2-polyprenyl-6-hydroxyphenyl methylase / 3-demethylubiquinone-9 3-methyltransferase